MDFLGKTARNPSLGQVEGRGPGLSLSRGKASTALCTSLWPEREGALAPGARLPPWCDAGLEHLDSRSSRFEGFVHLGSVEMVLARLVLASSLPLCAYTNHFL